MLARFGPPNYRCSRGARRNGFQRLGGATNRDEQRVTDDGRQTGCGREFAGRVGRGRMIKDSGWAGGSRPRHQRAGTLLRRTTTAAPTLSHGPSSWPPHACWTQRSLFALPPRPAPASRFPTASPARPAQSFRLHSTAPQPVCVRLAWRARGTADSLLSSYLF